MIGHDFTAYSGIDYILQSEDAVANFFVPFLNVLIATLYLVRRHRFVGIP